MKRTWSSESDERDTNQHSQAQLPRLLSLQAPVSPPRRKSGVEKDNAGAPETSVTDPDDSPSLAAIEAGQIEVADHLGIVSEKLQKSIRPASEAHGIPRLPISEWTDLYRRNEHPQGRHFVIHQHDHPVAGPHYDLRLQFSETSSVSWSVMYGLPGDPNSQRLNRNATETRVHCLWNHLIETASSKTGSMIIWDTGEYEILPYHIADSLPETDDSRSDSSEHGLSSSDIVSESAKLEEAFRNRKIRLRLHGTRLPKNYTVRLCMDKTTDFARPIRAGPKRRRRFLAPSRTTARAPSTSDSESEPSTPVSEAPSRVSGLSERHGQEASVDPQSDQGKGNHSDDDTDIQIQKNNAYPGSFNTIGSIHQRRWFLGLDRANSGFEPTRKANGDSKSNKKIWTRKLVDGQLGGFEPFYVRGPDVERSVVTGRLGQDVLEDEQVEGFQPRKGWRPVLK